MMGLENTIRAVAVLEAAKGIMVLLTGLGALSLVHHDIQHVAEQLVNHFHLNPAKHYPRIFLDTAAHLTDARLWWFALFALIYALVRFVESYGLWRGRRWAEWFAAVSGGMYIPLEIYRLSKGITPLTLSVLVINLLVVGLMIDALRHSHKAP